MTEVIAKPAHRAINFWGACAGLILVCAMLAACRGNTRSPFDRPAKDILSCQMGESAQYGGYAGAPATPAQLVDGGPTPTIGPPSDLWKQATAVFEAEQWLESIPLLQRVVRGEGQDDKGNRQLAEYTLGIAYYRMGRFDLALQLFEPIAENATHVKHGDTLVWLANLSIEPDTSGRAIDLSYLYKDDDISYLDADNRELEYLIHFMWGRAAYRVGAFQEAAEGMALVARDPRFREMAIACQGYATQSGTAIPVQ